MSGTMMGDTRFNSIIEIVELLACETAKIFQVIVLRGTIITLKDLKARFDSSIVRRSNIVSSTVSTPLFTPPQVEEDGQDLAPF
jgi:hypothetical protein